MTEPGPSRPASREDGGRSPRGAAQLDDCPSDPENVTEERRRRGRMAVECLQAADQEHQEASGRRKPVLVRSKTFDNSLLTQVQTDLDSKIERKKSHYSQLSKSNSQYHKIFKEISKEEQLRQSYTCALQKDILYQGRMFVSDHWICFHSKVFGRDTKIAIPVTSITNIKKTKTAILVPNALVIATANDRYVFVSLMARDNTYKFLMSVCLHLESDFSDLDGAATQIRPEIEDSSSSDSQTPDDDKLAGFAAPPLLDVLAHSDKAAPPPEQQLRARQQQQLNQQLNQQSPEKSLTGSEVMINSRVLRPISLSTLLIVYMFLVCVLVLSSCFLAFKIVSLEQKLQTLGSVTDFTHNVNRLLSGGADLNTEIFSEVLTINLLKLERVQKNLQRLLEEAD